MIRPETMNYQSLLPKQSREDGFMVMAIDIDAKREYVIKVERDKDISKQTKWILGVIDAVTLAKIDQMDVSYNDSTSETKITANILGRELEFVRYGLKGWENFKDKAGKTVSPRFTTISKAGLASQVLHNDSLCKIPNSVIRELAGEIRKDSALTDEEIKN